MEAYSLNKINNTDQLNNNYNKINFCDHLKSKSFNFYLDNMFNFDPKNKTKRFFNYKNKSKEITKNYFESLYIENLNLEWVALYNTNNLSNPNNINRDGCIFTLDFDEQGTLMASSTHNHSIEIWDLQQKKVKKILNDHKEIVTGIQFLKNTGNFQSTFSKYMMTCSLDKTIRLWKDFSLVTTFIEHNDWIRCISVSKSNDFFLSGCVSSVVKLWDMEKRKVINSITNTNLEPELLNTVNSLQFFNNSDSVFVSGLRDGSVKMFDTRTFKLINEFKAHKVKLNSVKISRSDNYLLSSGRDSVARLWDIRNLPVNLIFVIFREMKIK